MLPEDKGGADPTSRGLWQRTHANLHGVRVSCTQAAEAEAAQTAAAEKDPAKFSGKKSKAAAKKGAGSTQWDILIRSGIPEAEVPKFRCSAAFTCAV